MVEKLAIARANLNGTDKDGSRNSDRDDEVTKDIAAAGGERERLGDLNDEIGRAQLPAFGESGRRGSDCRIAFRRAGANPFGDDS